MSEWDNTVKALGDFGKRIVNRARGNLVTRGKNTSSMGLSRSISADVYEFANSIGVQVTSASYGKYVNLGVRGHMIGNWGGRNKGQQAPNSPYSFKFPAGAPRGIHRGFEDWFRSKPISPRNADGTFMSYKEGAFVMVRSARKYGLKPSYYMSDAITAELPKLQEDLELNVRDDIVQFLET